MTKLTAFAGIIFSLWLGISTPAHSSEALTDADAIVNRANLAAYYAASDGRAEARMLIRDAQGREQMRQFTILRRDREEGGEQDFLVVFSRPADVRNTVFLVAKKPGGDDDRWLYLPGLDLVKRISAGDKRSSFVGSHFFYEDVSGRSPREDSHRLIETSGQYYVIENTPLAPASVEFSRYTAWINRDNFLAEKIEYQDAQGEVYRRVEVLQSEMIQGHITVAESRVEDLRSGGETRLQFRYQSYDLGMGAEVFSERSLRKPPREWLRRAE
ncbi:outer membrane lipoprotein-sorting protein [Neptuniibacter halophilus]|uniref:outer membrane lipoprotein-sorting protein n=1 Tax=Neptuniibacter halophilus TaxID=651666 RepID=UPI0025732E20|nr:outer membrane lipoprotein-sorting protein [Neptuniibacter halophilus]